MSVCGRVAVLDWTKLLQKVEFSTFGHSASGMTKPLVSIKLMISE